MNNYLTIVVLLASKKCPHLDMFTVFTQSLHLLFAQRRLKLGTWRVDKAVLGLYKHNGFSCTTPLK